MTPVACGYYGRAVALAIVLLVSGCGLQSGTAPDAAASASHTAAPVLPNGIALTPGAQLVDGPTPISPVNGATGWSALGVTPAATSTATAVDQVQAALAAAGFTITGHTGGHGGDTVTARTGTSSALTWIVVTVTAPVPGAGPAIAYRAATTTS